MDFTEYQKQAMRTCKVTDKAKLLINSALGLAGESGEYADHAKKFSFQGHHINPEKLKEELGDVLWYVAMGAQYLGIGMEEIAQYNIDKLWRRYPEGFDSIRSQNRDGQ